MVAGQSEAAIYNLDLPSNGVHTSGASFTTAASYNGATFDISYALNAFATDVTVTPFIRRNGDGIGVGSTNDGATVGQQASVDGDDGEQLSITGLSITNFNAGTSGMVAGDLSISFNGLTFANGTAGPDNVAISFSGFGTGEEVVSGPTVVDLTALPNYSGTSTAVYLQPNSGNSSNRWSVSGIAVDVVPEPSSYALAGLGFAGMMLRRRRMTGRGATVRAGALLAAVWMAGTAVRGKDFCVATDGDDGNAGTTPEAPLATIQRAVDLMEPGDRCFIRGGVYRETVDLAGKAGEEGRPIRLMNYPGEVVDGTVEITADWEVDEGEIHKAKVKEGVSQLFVDGKLMTLARFPNALAFSDEVWDYYRPRAQQSRESVNGRVVDPGEGEKSISGAGFSFDGCIALLNFGAHATATRVVENHRAGTAEFEYSPKLLKYKTTLGYFFEGGVGNAGRKLLDVPQEWSYDGTTGMLYLWAEEGGSPQGREVRGKVRTYALVGDAGTKHIEIDGLRFFATAFSFKSSDDITIRNCELDYYTSSRRAMGVTGPSETASFTGTEEDFCEGITVYNCEFRHADGSGLEADFVRGMRIENNLFEEIDYVAANNDSGPGEVFTPTSTIRINKADGLVYRRNTISVAGAAQGFSANRYITGRGGKFRPEGYAPETINNIVCEYNFHTACGLTHKDGASLYIPEAHVMESVIRFNWFIGNGQRDFRWDGNNRPLDGVHGNLYRNVAVGTGLKRLSPSGGNGFRVKGSYHEVYHNLGINRGGELNIATEKGGNEETVTRNNVASHFTDNPIPGTSSNNYAPGKKDRRVQDMLRDWANRDFRPRADAVELIDQGVRVTCSVRGEEIDVTAGYKGAAPDLGPYEYGDELYWIPGRVEADASMPVPVDGGAEVKPDADLMFLGGMGGVASKIFLGTTDDGLEEVGSLAAPGNVLTLPEARALKPGTRAPIVNLRSSGRIFRLATLMAGASLIPFSSVQAEYRASNSTADDLIRKSKASHFLAQASMGGTVAEIEALATRIQQIGHIPACEEWMDQQMALPRGVRLKAQCAAMASADGVSDNNNAVGDYWHLGWWDQVINSDDQLRHRMAFALSQIVVVSTNYWNGLYRKRYDQHVSYYDMLMDNAFTSHRDLLQDVTYDPMMGVWLSHAQNDKGDPAQGIYPDENYAREIMQLFSCGIYSQDAWGNFLTDANGKPIENYDNEDIKEFAQVFTGLSINDQRGFFSKNLTLLGNGPLIMMNDHHDTSEKHLLNGVVLPAGQGGNVDISQALDNLATHPSTAPYFSRLLIQRLTSSNPSLAYMKRVTDTWNGGGTYGTGVTGDFKAVLKAILLDPEVRNSITYDKEPSGGAVIVRANSADPMSGKIKEPLLKMAQFYRFAQPVSSAADGYVRLKLSDRAYGQAILSANSVFNFYDAGFAPSNGPIGDYVADYEAANPGSTLEVTAPEAQILGGNVVKEFQQFYSLPLSGPGDYVKASTTTTELTEITFIKSGVFTFDIGMIRYLDVMLCHGQLPYELALEIENDLKSNGETWDEKVAQIISVIHGSPAYSVIR
eukprot:g3967.t1